MGRTGLVLGAGGMVGQAFHAGVLATLEQEVGWDPRTAEVIVGSSAGSVTGATLRLGVAASDLAARALGLPVSAEGAGFFAAVDGADEALPVPSVGDLLHGWHLPSPALVARTIRRPWAVRPAAIASTLLPSGRYDLRERTQVLDGFRRGWPPGLLICAIRQDDGRRVVFGRPGAPFARVSEAVAASCAIPSYFAPVPIGGRYHVDGGVHSATNADVLSDAGLDVVIVVAPMSAAHGSSRSADAGMRWAMHRRLEREIRRLRAQGTEVVRFEPGPGTLAVMGLNAMAEDRSAAVVEAARADALAHATSSRSTRRLASLLTSRSPRRLTHTWQGGPVDRATIDFYEARAADYERGREPTHLEPAEVFGARRPAGVVVDLGSGPGWYTAALGSPAIGLDAALAMVRRTRAVAPGTMGVQADLSALPFRHGALAAGWARNTYVHLRAAEVPAALADLHRSLAVGAPVELTLFRGVEEGRGIFPDDDFPGRWFSTWTDERLHDLVHGAGFGLDELEVRTAGSGDQGFRVRLTRLRSLPDHVSDGMRLLVSGLNPSEHAADAGIGYVTPGNRFWPAALESGLVTHDRDPRHALLAHGIGMTDLVKRATPRADALTRDEYRAGVERLDRLCAWLEPGAVCVVGMAGWRAAVDRKAVPGWQGRDLGGRPVYVMPSTSGLNAATPLRALVEHLEAAATGT